MVCEVAEVVADLNFCSSVSNSDLMGCNLEGRLIDLKWICETAIFLFFERKRCWDES